MDLDQQTETKLFKIAEIDYDRNTAVWLTILSLFICSLGIIFLIIISGNTKLEVEQAGYSIIQTLFFGILLFLIIPFPVIIIHELLHGVGFRFYDYKPTFGFVFLYNFFPVAYTFTAGKFTKKQLNVVLILPFIVITGGGVLLTFFFSLLHVTFLFYMFYFISLLNLAGCVGDFYTFYRLYDYPSGIIIENKGKNDPLIIWNENESSSLKRKPSRISLIVDNVIAFIAFFMIVEISLVLPITLFIFIFLPILSSFNVQNLNLLLWVVTATSGQWMISTNSFNIILLSLIVASFMTLKFHQSKMAKRKIKGKDNQSNDLLMPFIA